MMSAAPRPTRREFLQGKAAVDALAQFDVGPPEGPPLPPSTTAAGHQLRFSRRAMACTFEIFINAARHEHGTESALAALDLVDQLEEQLSVYREHSEVSRLNRAAASGPVQVEERLFALLARAVELHQETGGAFDVTAGTLSTTWGFTRRHGSIPTGEEINDALAAIGTGHLQLAPQQLTVRFQRPGLEINLGSIGKGYALDRAAELLLSEGIDDFLMHGGSSSVLARGAPASSPDQPAWVIGVRHPLHPEQRLGHLRLADRALATSGSGTQFFMHQGRRYGHILDPRSGWPAEGVLTVTVLAPTAAEADALATAFYVMGPEAAEKYCQKHDKVAALMLCPAARQGGITTHRFGLTEEDWTASA